jgi:hypothetical protein
MTSAEHPTPEMLIAYLDRNLDPAGDSEIEEHLYACDRCLDEVAIMQPRTLAGREPFPDSVPPRTIRPAAAVRQQRRPVAAGRAAIAGISFAAGLALAFGVRNWAGPPHNRIQLRSAPVIAAAYPAAGDRVRVELGQTRAAPGGTATLRIALAPASSGDVSGVEVDFTVDEHLHVLRTADGRPDCTVNRDLDKGASGFSFRPGRCRNGYVGCEFIHAIVVSADNREAIPPGAELFRCQVAVPAATPDGAYPVESRRALYSPRTGGDLRAAAEPGWVLVGEATAPTPTVVPAATPTPEMPARGGGDGCQVGGAATPFGAVWLLAVVPVLRRRRGSRSRAAGEASRRQCRTPQAVGIGILLTMPVVAQGEVRLQVAPLTTTPGSTVAISVFLEATRDEEVVATRNDVSFDPDFLSIVADDDERPLCRPHESIAREASAFGFRPRGCGAGGAVCTGVRALVLSFTNPEPIESGSVLYDCRVRIRADATPGTYPIRVDDVRYSPADGSDLTGVGGVADITVVDVSIPSPTATVAASTPTPAPTQSTGDPGDANCDARLSADDIAAVARAIYTGAADCTADCNRDGDTNSSDLTCVAVRLATADPSSSGGQARR